MTNRLVVLLVNTDPRHAGELGAPFYQAATAAALEYEVDVVCAAASAQLMRRGVAEHLYVKPGSPMSVHAFIKDAHGLGVRFWCCSASLALFDMTEADLIPECGGVIGMAGILRDIMEGECKVLSY